MKRNEIWKTNSMDYCNKRNEKNKEMKTYCETQTKNFPNEKISHQWILAKQRNTMNRDLPIV